jgi:hypothetical protein
MRQDLSRLASDLAVNDSRIAKYLTKESTQAELEELGQLLRADEEVAVFYFTTHLCAPGRNSNWDPTFQDSGYLLVTNRRLFFSSYMGGAVNMPIPAIVRAGTRWGGRRYKKSSLLDVTGRGAEYTFFFEARRYEDKRGVAKMFAQAITRLQMAD